jgi:hypothetical protein
MGTPRTIVVLCVAIALFGAACGDDGGRPSAEGSPSNDFNEPFTDTEAYPVVASSEVVVGENRFMVGLLNDQDAPIANPQIDMTIDFYDLDESSTEPVSSADMDFFWTLKPYVGLYVANVSFDHAGSWGAVVNAAGTDFDGNDIDVSVKTGFDVAQESDTPGIGERGPAVDTPTADDVKKLSEISTDPHPNPRFYELSIAQAVNGGKPSVVVFATPKYCESQTCGPTLEIVKSVATKFPKANFVHVEPYDLKDPEARAVVPAVTKWGLPSEPWVFVLDAQGRVVAKFEGGLAPSELSSALEDA